MTEDQLVEKVAKALYSMNVTVFMWNREQDSLRNSFFTAARNTVEALKGQGLALVEAEEPEVVEKKQVVEGEAKEEKPGQAKRSVGKKEEE